MGISAPKKKNLAPPPPNSPQTPSRPLPPPPPPPAGETPPLGFSMQNRPPLPPGPLGSPFPSPEQKKKIKNIRNVHQVKRFLGLFFVGKTLLALRMRRHCTGVKIPKIRKRGFRGQNSHFPSPQKRALWVEKSPFLLWSPVVIFGYFFGIFRLFGYFLRLFSRPPKRPFLRLFCDLGPGGPGDSCKWRLGSQSKSPKSGKEGSWVKKLPMLQKRAIWVESSPFHYRAPQEKWGFFDSKRPFLRRWEMGVFWPRNPLFLILGLLTPVQCRRFRNSCESGRGFARTARKITPPKNQGFFLSSEPLK